MNFNYFVFCLLYWSLPSFVVVVVVVSIKQNYLENCQECYVLCVSLVISPWSLERDKSIVDDCKYLRQLIVNIWNVYVSFYLFIHLFIFFSFLLFDLCSDWWEDQKTIDKETLLQRDTSPRHAIETHDTKASR